MLRGSECDETPSINIIHGEFKLNIVVDKLHFSSLQEMLELEGKMKTSLRLTRWLLTWSGLSAKN